MSLAAKLHMKQVCHLCYVSMLEDVQHSQKDEEEQASHADDFLKHWLVDDERLAVAWLVMHHIL